MGRAVSWRRFPLRTLGGARGPPRREAGSWEAGSCVQVGVGSGQSKWTLCSWDRADVPALLGALASLGERTGRCTAVLAKGPGRCGGAEGRVGAQVIRCRNRLSACDRP